MRLFACPPIMPGFVEFPRGQTMKPFAHPTAGFQMPCRQGPGYLAENPKRPAPERLTPDFTGGNAQWASACKAGHLENPALRQAQCERILINQPVTFVVSLSNHGRNRFFEAPSNVRRISLIGFAIHHDLP